MVETESVTSSRSLYNSLSEASVGLVFKLAGIYGGQTNTPEFKELIAGSPVPPPAFPNGTATSLYIEAQAYYLLRRMVQDSGGDPGPDMLDELGLQAMKRQFERDERKDEERRGGGRAGGS